MRALPGSPEERWKVDARRFAVALRKECRNRIREIEECGGFNPPLWDLIPKQFGEKEKRRAYPVFIPGGCMRIRLKEHPAFLDVMPLPWIADVPYIGLRYASHGEACQFLRILAQKTEIRLMGADKCRCEVAREGTRTSIIELHGLVGGGSPEHCLELLEKDSDRAVAKSVFPPYDKEGRPIPE